MEKRPVAYQLYSVREEAEKNLASVLETLKKQGYEGVEFAGFYGHSAAQIRKMLETYGLKAVSSHVPLQKIEEDMFGTIAYHQEIGCPYIAVPYLEEEKRPGMQGFAHVLQVIHRFAALAKAGGIQVLYHNHDCEFVTLSGMYGLDFLDEAIPSDLLKTELDVCWVKYAGEEPATYIRKYAGRCPIIHLKDYVGQKEEGLTPYALIGLEEKEKKEAPAFEFRPVGYGCQDVKSILEAGIESEAEWFVVEQDQSVGRPPLEAAGMSIGTLKQLGLV